ncbi:MAG: hypothetical protein KF855_03450 [Acidobacteria bacterium]|nr:hypothetical protein [Acidobacteriota bacterium]
MIVNRPVTENKRTGAVMLGPSEDFQRFSSLLPESWATTGKTLTSFSVMARGEGDVYFVSRDPGQLGEPTIDEAVTLETQWPWTLERVDLTNCWLRLVEGDESESEEGSPVRVEFAGIPSQSL